MNYLYTATTWNEAYKKAIELAKPFYQNAIDNKTKEIAIDIEHQDGSHMYYPSGLYAYAKVGTLESLVVFPEHIMPQVIYVRDLEKVVAGGIEIITDEIIN